MHRSYQPLKPATNRFLQRRWDEHRYQDHRDKVEEATPVVDTKGIKTPIHMQNKLKKVQIQEERLAIIDRDNHHTVQRLYELLRDLNQTSISPKSEEIDLWVLNAAKRREWLLQISHENQAIFHRISSQKSHYRRDVCDEDWERVARRRDDIARYPRGIQHPGKSVNFSSRCRSSATEDQSVREKHSKTHSV
ncbi:hypothetical protein DNTS_028390 [Danionella cerebrum]|uniref:Uncharacterized protein n=1 Tax=Danionella cerebrum TaxID=2873325 RepID=A0A553MSW0_9TELE|nr:hypothetical protein DNTS_028390 [Danionella translucida]